MKYFFGFLATVGLVILVFILVLRGFSGKSAPKDQLVLGDHANSSMTVELTVDGKVSADQNHFGYRISIDRHLAKIETYQGYQNSVITTKTYANNNAAYATFLRALDQAGFAKGDDESAIADERGQCASGRRFIYSIQDSPQGDKRYWSSTCGIGTFKGNRETVEDLFERQIPDFSKTISGLKI